MSRIWKQPSDFPGYKEQRTHSSWLPNEFLKQYLSWFGVISPGLPLCRAARWWADVVIHGHLGEEDQLGLSQPWFPALAFSQPSSALTFRRDMEQSHGSCLLPPQPKILFLTSEDLEKEWMTGGRHNRKRWCFYRLFSKEAVDPAGIKDKIKDNKIKKEEI